MLFFVSRRNSRTATRLVEAFPSPRGYLALTFQIAWFLAPTVALAEQQYEAIRAQIPGVQSKLIRGCDNVDAWSTKPGVWDAVLYNTRIVVSTYQILFDAVAHAFVPLASVGLIVVDEGVLKPGLHDTLLFGYFD